MVIKSTAIQIRCITLPDPRGVLLLPWILWLPKFFFFFFMLSSYVPTTLSGTEKVKWKLNCSVVSYSLWPHGLYSPWNSPGQNTVMGNLSLLQGILPNPGIEPRFPALQMDSLPAEPQVKPGTGKGFNKIFVEFNHHHWNKSLMSTYFKKTAHSGVVMQATPSNSYNPIGKQNIFKWKKKFFNTIHRW